MDYDSTLILQSLFSFSTTITNRSSFYIAFLWQNYFFFNLISRDVFSTSDIKTIIFNCSRGLKFKMCFSYTKNTLLMLYFEELTPKIINFHKEIIGQCLPSEITKQQWLKVIAHCMQDQLKKHLRKMWCLFSKAFFFLWMIVRMKEYTKCFHWGNKITEYSPRFLLTYINVVL